MGVVTITIWKETIKSVKRDNNVGDKVLDIIDVLAQDCVKKCAKLRPNYQELITKNNGF